MRITASSVTAQPVVETYSAISIIHISKSVIVIISLHSGGVRSGRDDQISSASGPCEISFPKCSEEPPSRYLFENFEGSSHHLPFLIVRAEAVHVFGFKVQNHRQGVARRC